MSAGALKPVRVLVADSYRVVRMGIRVMLGETRSYRRFEVEEAETTEEALAKAVTGNIRVVLMDYDLPGRGGPKATELILSRRPDVCVLGLSFSDERSRIEQMVSAGAKGCVLKNIEPDTLGVAIQTVMSGKLFYSNELALKLLEPRTVRPTLSELARLTAREQEIFRAILGGLRDREIAEQLGIGKRTVDKHREHLMGKLGARNAVELVRVGVRLGLMG